MDEHGMLYSYKLFDIQKKTWNPHTNVISQTLNQSNHHKMHRKVGILNKMFLLLITEYQFKVVFKVKFWIHYQIGHNYKANEFKIIT